MREWVLNWLDQVALALDRLLNALTWGNSTNTVSARVGAASYRGARWAEIAEFLIDAMPWFGSGHCFRQAVREGLIL